MWAGVCCGHTASRAAAPVDDLGFVDLEAVIVVCSEARRRSHSTVDVKHRRTAATDQVMVIVADAVLVPCRRSGGLDAANQVLVDQQTERVVDGLTRDRADNSTDILGQVISRRMRTKGQGTHDRQPLRGDLDPVLAQELIPGVDHGHHSTTHSGLSQEVDRVVTQHTPQRTRWT